MDNHLYFLANTISRAECSGGTSELNELWRSDGTDAGTSMLVNFDCGTEAEWPTALTAAGDHLYMMMRPLMSSNAFNTLWRTDGNAANIELVIDADPIFYSLQDDVRRIRVEALNDRAYFFAQSTVNTVMRTLWEKEPIGAAHEVTEQQTPVEGFDTTGWLAPFKDTMVFAGNRFNTGVEIIHTSFTQPCFTLLDIRPGPDTSVPAHFLVHENMLFFTADNGQSGNELWRYKPVEPMTCTPMFLPIVKVE